MDGRPGARTLLAVLEDHEGGHGADADFLSDVLWGR